VAFLRRVASQVGRTPEIAEHLCSEAWSAFVAGDLDAYRKRVAEEVTATAHPGDLVLLAQASMAPVAGLVARSDLSILSSPRLGVAAALAAHRRVNSNTGLRGA
jgi:hypothetical protein